MKKNAIAKINRFGKWVLRHISIGLNLIIFRERKTICYSTYVRRKSGIGKVLYNLINTWVFWEKDHCRKSYLLERRKK